MGKLTTHILDTSLGVPAQNVGIKLYQKINESINLIKERWSEQILYSHFLKSFLSSLTESLFGLYTNCLAVRAPPNSRGLIRPHHPAPCQASESSGSIIRGSISRMTTLAYLS